MPAQPTKEQRELEKLDKIIAWIKSNPWGEALIERIRNA